jgi:serine/threonine protein kinase
MSRFTQGQILGDYTIIEEIGHGKFSDVYAVSHKDNTETRLCIKIQRNNESSHEASEDEIEFLRKINFEYGGHENIIKMVQTFEHEGLICIVYRRYYCDLLNYLHDYYPDGMPVELATKIIEQVLSAVKFLHSKNLVHTDIKPDNILLACDPADNCTVDTIKIVISDFGTMRVIDGVDYSDHLATPEYQAV